VNSSGNTIGVMPEHYRRFPMTTTTAPAAPTALAAPVLAFVMLHVTDFDAASRYYTDTLGFTPMLDQDAPGFRMFAPVNGGIPYLLGKQRRILRRRAQWNCTSLQTTSMHSAPHTPAGVRQ